MFEVGKVYKVKVESEPGNVGFGRATIIEKSGGQIDIQVKTSKEAVVNLPRGAKIWFVNDSTDSTFNGLWASTIVNSHTAQRKTTLTCSAPKYEPPMARRRAPRVSIDVPVKMSSLEDAPIGSNIRTKDISRSGIGLETGEELPESLGDEVKIVIESSVGEIATECRVIRVDKNWLANKCTIGLEYMNMDTANVATLDKLLILLGGKPRHAEVGVGDGTAQKQTGLSEWMTSSRSSVPVLNLDQAEAGEEAKDAQKQSGLADWASASKSNVPTLNSNRFVGGANKSQDDSSVEDAAEDEKPGDSDG